MNWDNYWKNGNKLKFDGYNWNRTKEVLGEMLKDKDECLELGCGGGMFMVFLNKVLGKKVVGIENNRNGYVLAKRNLKRYGMNAKNVIFGDMFYDIPLKSECCLSFGLIEHFDDIDEIVKTHMKYVVKNGLVVISVPNVKGIKDKIKYYLYSEFFRRYDINRNIDVAILKESMRRCGLKDVDGLYYQLPLLPNARLPDMFKIFENKIISQGFVVCGRK